MQGRLSYSLVAMVRLCRLAVFGKWFSVRSKMDKRTLRHSFGYLVIHKNTEENNVLFPRKVARRMTNITPSLPDE